MILTEIGEDALLMKFLEILVFPLASDLLFPENVLFDAVLSF